MIFFEGAGRLQIYDHYVRVDIFLTFTDKANPPDFIKKSPFIPPRYTQVVSDHYMSGYKNLKIILSDYLFDAYIYACERSESCYYQVTNKFL